QRAAPDESALRQLFSRPGISGVAVVLGSASGGLVCRDFDQLIAYERWAATHRDLAAILPTVRTCRGTHLYFQGPEGFADLGDGEYRGDSKHYCLLPPSQHPDGPLYSWLIPLPEVELPIIDPHKEGLWCCNTESTENTENTHSTPLPLVSS